MKYFAYPFFALAALITSAAWLLETLLHGAAWALRGAARYFASEDMDALALELEAEDEARAAKENVTSCHISAVAPEAEASSEITDPVRAAYEARAMASRIAISEMTRSDVSRRLEGALVDEWLDWMQPVPEKEGKQS